MADVYRVIGRTIERRIIRDDLLWRRLPQTLLLALICWLFPASQRPFWKVDLVIIAIPFILWVFEHFLRPKLVFLVEGFFVLMVGLDRIARSGPEFNEWKKRESARLAAETERGQNGQFD